MNQRMLRLDIEDIQMLRKLSKSFDVLLCSFVLPGHIPKEQQEDDLQTLLRSMGTIYYHEVDSASEQLLPAYLKEEVRKAREERGELKAGDEFRAYIVLKEDLALLGAPLKKASGPSLPS